MKTACWVVAALLLVGALLSVSLSSLVADAAAAFPAPLASAFSAAGNGEGLEEASSAAAAALEEVEAAAAAAAAEEDAEAPAEAAGAQQTGESANGGVVPAEPAQAVGAPRRRLMAMAGAGLVLLAGGALANEHFSSVKAGFQSLFYSLKNKPFSWTLYTWRMPRVDEEDFPDFRIVAEGLEAAAAEDAAAAGAAAAAAAAGLSGAPGGRRGAGGPGASAASNGLSRRRTFVHIVEKPSAALADFLGLGPEEREHGFVIKGRSYRPEFGREQAAWEVFVMQRHVPRHPLFFSIIKAFRSPRTGNFYLILPRACCDLSQYYRGAPKTVDVRTAAAEMALSLHVLHERGFLHRDVKPPNYFVSQSGHVLLADFEMLWPVRLPCPPEEATQTRGFTAPELRRYSSYVPYTIKSDVYALGMAYARLLMRVRRHQKVWNQGLLTKLILEMVANAVHERLDLKGVMAHKYFEGIDWDRVARGEATPPCPLARQVMHRLAAARRREQPQQQQPQEQHQQQQKQQQQKQQHKQQKQQQKQQQQQQQKQQQEEGTETSPETQQETKDCDSSSSSSSSSSRVTAGEEEDHREEREEARPRRRRDTCSAGLQEETAQRAAAAARQQQQRLYVLLLGSKKLLLRPQSGGGSPTPRAEAQPEEEQLRGPRAPPPVGRRSGGPPGPPLLVQ
ncbi:hypothetical protein Efla_007235 [Eimeria flavescens]